MSAEPIEDHEHTSWTERTAEWLRTADVASVKAELEQQVRTKPGRALLIALGVGYVLGRLLRGKPTD